jgi:hypothetical protein
VSSLIVPTADGRAVLANYATGWAYGPVFASVDDAGAFLRWLGKDPQDVLLEALLDGRQPDLALEAVYRTWQDQRQDEAAPAARIIPIAHA